MNRRVSNAALALLFVAMAVGPASAQSSEMSGLVGFTPSAGLDRQAPELDDLAIRSGMTWGTQFTHFFTPQWGVDVTWTQQASALELVTSAGAADLYSMTLSQLQADVVYQFGDADARLRPFVFGGAGATFFTARDLESETKAAFGFGGGIKYFRWRSVGFRGQFRYKPTWLNDDPEGDFCDPFGFCQGWLHQAEIVAGVIIRF
jgi:outer membrane protein W